MKKRISIIGIGIIFSIIFQSLPLQAKTNVVGLWGVFSNSGTESYENSICLIELKGFQLTIYNKTDEAIYIDKRLSFVTANDTSKPIGDIAGSLSQTTSDIQATFTEGTLLIPPRRTITIFNYKSREISDGFNLTYKNTSWNKTLIVEETIWFHSSLRPFVEYKTGSMKVISYDLKSTGVWLKEKQKSHIIAMKSRFVDSGKPVKPKIGMTRHFERQESPICFKADLVIATKRDFSDKSTFSVSSYVSDMVVDDFKGFSGNYGPTSYSYVYQMFAMY